MKFKEFISWCNDRAADGHWSLDMAIACITIIDDVNKQHFWKKEKYWRDNYEDKVKTHIMKFY